MGLKEVNTITQLNGNKYRDRQPDIMHTHSERPWNTQF